MAWQGSRTELKVDRDTITVKVPLELKQELASLAHDLRFQTVSHLVRAILTEKIPEYRAAYNEAAREKREIEAGRDLDEVGLEEYLRNLGVPI